MTPPTDTLQHVRIVGVLNTDGGLALYRGSKAAQNALARAFSVEDANPAGVGVLSLHPGWVQTETGSDNAPVTIAESVRGLQQVMAQALAQPPSHTFLDFEGRELPW